MANEIVIRSTPRGFISHCFRSAVWTAIFLAAGLWISSYIDSVYVATHVSSFTEFDKLSWSMQEHYPLMEPPIIYVGMYASYVIAAIVALVELLTLFYGTKEVNTFANNKAGRIGRLVRETYSFPFTRSVHEISFDRIIEVQVEQSGIDRLLNTGDLRVKTVTFTNADSDGEWNVIPAIEDPHGRKLELEAAMPDHEGLLVKMSRDRTDKSA